MEPTAIRGVDNGFAFVSHGGSIGRRWRHTRGRSDRSQGTANASQPAARGAARRTRWIHGAEYHRGGSRLSGRGRRDGRPDADEALGGYAARAARILAAE